jgi:hypothetical protein
MQPFVTGATPATELSSSNFGRPAKSLNALGPGLIGRVTAAVQAGTRTKRTGLDRCLRVASDFEEAAQPEQAAGGAEEDSEAQQIGAVLEHLEDRDVHVQEADVLGDLNEQRP